MSARNLLVLLCVVGCLVLAASVAGFGSAWPGVAALCLAFALCGILEGLGYLLARLKSSEVAALEARLAALEAEKERVAKVLVSIREQVVLRE